MRPDGRIAITGGAGFIGSNLASSYLEAGRPVTVIDNLSRSGAEDNLQWLRARYGKLVRFAHCDVRNADELASHLQDSTTIFHFAAQVAVTTSLVDPLYDYSVNLKGTLNVLECARKSKLQPTVVFTSTNKVYGALTDVKAVRTDRRYTPSDARLAIQGVNESHNLDFHSPYGCSKGGADQYVIDYGRCFGFPTVVFRMSCICGPHQHGTEDQGWVAHFVKQALDDEPVVIYGDGMQVRDLLSVTDLVRAFHLVEQPAPALQHRAFNIGGGPNRAVSLLEVIEIIQQLTGRRTSVSYGPMRTGDQVWYVTDSSAFQRSSGWQPKLNARETVEQIVNWLSVNRRALYATAAPKGASQCVLHS